MMEVTEGRAGNATTLRIVGRVDSSVSKVLEQKVQDVVSRDEHVVVDLGGMNYVSSAGLRSFIVLAKHARAKNKTIALTAMRDEVVEIFEISGLLELFSVYDTLDAAVAALPR
jgi:anti-anti-sigma factor